jgi:putative phage-type endonuclease
MPRLTPTQLADRQAGIGSSDIPAIMGLAPKKTLWDVYLEKRGLIEPDDTDGIQEAGPAAEAKEIGHELEEWLARWYSQQSGDRLVVAPTVYADGERAFFANLDRLVDGKPEIVEIKIVGAYMSFDWIQSETDGAPDYVHAQCQWQLFCAGPRFERVNVAVCLGGTQRRVFVIERDDTLIEIMVRQAHAFMAMVRDGSDPKMDDSSACRDYLITKYPRDTSPRRDATDEENGIAEMRIRAASAEKRARAEKLTCDARLVALCAEAGGVKGNGWSVSHRIAPRSKTGERAYRFTAQKERVKFNVLGTHHKSNGAEF